jgi:hypothetical protein
MHPFSSVQHANNASPFRPSSAKAARQRSGSDPFTVSLLNNVNKYDMTQSAFREVFGSNIPLVVSATTKDEAFDQGVLQTAETLNAFVVTLGINHLLREGTEALKNDWGKEVKNGVRHLSKNQALWQRFTTSMPIYAWLIGFEFFSPLLRNMITLQRTGVDSFAGITDAKKCAGSQVNRGSANALEPASHKPNDQNRLSEDAIHQRMHDYQMLVVRDAAITLPAVGGLLGVGLLGMKHGWKMPHVTLDTPKALDSLLGKAHPNEHGLKKGIRKASSLLVENLFGSQAYRANKGRLDLVDQALLPDNGDWAKVSNLMSTLVWAMPTYMALAAYSRDDLEKPEIAMRAGAFVVANLIFPNAIKSFLEPRIKGKHIPYVGGEKNISLLASLGLSTVLYTALPVMISHMTRQYRRNAMEKSNEAKQSKAEHFVNREA